MSQLLDLKDQFGVTVSGIPDTEDVNSPSEKLLAFVNNSIKTGEGSYTYGDPAPSELRTAAQQSLSQQKAVTDEQEAPKTTAKGLLDSFIKEAGPMAAVTGVGLLAGGTGAAFLGLGAKGAETLNNLLGFEEGEGIADPLAAGRKFLEAIGVDEDPDTVWERIAAGAGIGVDEAITSVLGGKVLQGLGGIIKNASNLPNVLNKVGSVTEKIGSLFSSKVPTQIVGGASSGAGAEGGQILAENMDMGPTGQLLMSLLGGMAADMTAAVATDLINYAKNLARANNSSLPEAIEEVVSRAKSEGIDSVLSDFKPTSVAADDRRNVRELASGGIRGVRGEVQAPQRRESVRRLASEYGVDINDPNVDEIFTKVAQDFNETRGAQKEALTSAKAEIINQFSSPDSPVPTPRTNELIDELLETMERENIPGSESMEKSLRTWQTRLSDVQTVPKSGDVIPPQDKSLNTIEAIRDRLGEGFKTADGVIIDGSQRMSNKLYRALREDMGEYISNVGGAEASESFEGIMSGLSDLAKDLETTSIKTLIDSPRAEIDTISSIIRNGRAEDVGILYRRLSPEGQAQARSAVVADVIDQVMDNVPLSTRGERVFSPNKFAEKVLGYGGSKGILFDTADTEHLDGLAKVLQDTMRAEQSGLIKDVMIGEGVQGSQRLITGIIARNPLATIPTLLMAKATKGVMYKTMEKPFFRDLLIKYDSLPNRARSGTAGTELLKRMNEVIKSSFAAQERSQNARTADYQGEQ